MEGSSSWWVWLSILVGEAGAVLGSWREPSKRLWDQWAQWTRPSKLRLGGGVNTSERPLSGLPEFQPSPYIVVSFRIGPGPLGS